jgi:general secretion pathway protein M
MSEITLPLPLAASAPPPEAALDLPPGLPASRGRRRLLALGLLAAVLGMLWLVVLGPLVEGVLDRQERETRQTTLLLRLEPLRAQGPALRRQLDALEAELASPDLLLRAATAGQATALLQAALRTLLAAEGLTAEQFQPLPAVPEGNLTRLGLRVELRATLPQLHALLRGLEAHRPLLAVGDALVASRRDGGGLTIRLDIQALARLGAGNG